MFTREEAKKIANELLDDPVKTCKEYDKAYYFTDGILTIGVNHEIAILKESGEAISFLEYIERFVEA